MTSIDGIDQPVLAEYADKFFRLTQDNRQLNIRQLCEYVSQMLSVELGAWHRQQLEAIVLNAGGVRDKAIPHVFNMPAVRKRGGLPGRRHDKLTIDMFGEDAPVKAGRRK